MIGVIGTKMCSKDSALSSILPGIGCVGLMAQRAGKTRVFDHPFLSSKKQLLAAWDVLSFLALGKPFPLLVGWTASQCMHPVFFAFTTFFFGLHLIPDNYKVTTHMIMICNAMICIDFKMFHLWSLHRYVHVVIQIRINWISHDCCFMLLCAHCNAVHHGWARLPFFID